MGLISNVLFSPFPLETASSIPRSRVHCTQANCRDMSGWILGARCSPISLDSIECWSAVCGRVNFVNSLLEANLTFFSARWFGSLTINFNDSIFKSYDDICIGKGRALTSVPTPLLRQCISNLYFPIKAPLSAQWNLSTSSCHFTS